MRTEILSPAGNKESFISAIHHGCDAIYIGGLKFGARAQAQNFTIDEIIELINYAHLYEVKVYVTVNTLIKDEEFLEAVSFVKQLYINNVDAIIVQDIGLASYLLKVFPDIVLHASTQMNIHSFDQALFLKNLGFKRIVLARECKYELIKKIKQEIDIELEVFVHGALCMSYSGNCLMSSVIGKRSGNRGKCAQPCRLLYSLNDSNKHSYLLSPKDLMTLNDLDKLLDLNIDSLKIEGRMKSDYYIATVVRTYRQLIDDIVCGNEINYDYYFNEISKAENRASSTGFLFNEPSVEEQLYDRDERPTKEFVGIVKSYDKASKLCILEQRNYFTIGDKLEFFGPNLKNTIYEVKEIRDTDLNILDAARHPKQLIVLNVDFEVSCNDMIRLVINK